MHGQIQMRVDVFFGGRGDGRNASLLRRRVLAVVGKQAVLVESGVQSPGTFAELDIVFFASGEVEHGGAEGCGVHDAEVYLHALCMADRCLGVAAGEHFGGMRFVNEGID